MRLHPTITIALAMQSCLMLTACGRLGDARDRYDIVKQQGDLGETCRAARDVEEAALHDKDADAYKEWHLTASLECMSAQLNQGE